MALFPCSGQGWLFGRFAVIYPNVFYLKELVKRFDIVRKAYILKGFIDTFGIILFDLLG